ncbi:hypothetical protein FOL47_002310, partial [Perkinsus chesapeaki]
MSNSHLILALFQAYLYQRICINQSIYQRTMCTYGSLLYFMWTASCMFAILGSAILPVGGGQVIELDAFLGSLPGYESYFNPYCHLKDMGLWLTVDTGARAFHLIQSEWYDSVMGPYSCANLYAGCYVCKTECDHRHAATRVETFLDGRHVEIFEHKDDFKIGSVDVGEIKFELVFGQDPPPYVFPVFNILGLGRQHEGGFPPLLYQLIDKNPKMVNSRTFAIYFNVKAPNRDIYFGKVLLGGGDPNLYKPPLLYLQFTDATEYMVPLRSMQVGDIRIDIDQNILLDSGTNMMVVPPLYYGAIMGGISKAVSQPLVWEPAIKLWSISCSNYSSMPKLTLNLGPGGEVRITM